MGSSFNPFDAFDPVPPAANANLLGGVTQPIAQAQPFQAPVVPVAQPTTAGADFVYDLDAFDPFSSGKKEKLAKRKSAEFGKSMLQRALSSENVKTQQSDDNWAAAFTWDDEENDVDDGDDDDEASEATDVEEEVEGEETGESIHVADDHGESKPTYKRAEYGLIVKNHLSRVDSLYRFLTRPIPKSLGTVHCTIKRKTVGMHMNFNVYELYVETNSGRLGDQLLTAHRFKKRGFNSYFAIQIGSTNKNEEGTIIANLIYNSLGTAFVAHNSVKAHRGRPRDLCCVAYKKNIGKGPRKMMIALPAFVDETKNLDQHEWPHKKGTKNSPMLKALKSLELSRLQPLINKPPTWNKRTQSWTLDFHGRVTRSSVKNFQLVRPKEQSNVVLQHGRIGSNSFTMDVAYPMSMISAFTVCISSLHPKIGVE